jgi:hypothetical protein
VHVQAEMSIAIARVARRHGQCLHAVVVAVAVPLLVVAVLVVEVMCGSVRQYLQRPVAAGVFEVVVLAVLIALVGIGALSVPLLMVQQV